MLLKASWDIRDAVLATTTKGLVGQIQHGPQPKAWDPENQKVVPLGTGFPVGGLSPSKEALDAVNVMPEWMKEALAGSEFVVVDKEEWYYEVPPELHTFFSVVHH